MSKGSSTRLRHGGIRDVPEALTHGAEENALAWARDALLVALSGYTDDRRPIPGRPASQWWKSRPRKR